MKPVLNAEHSNAKNYIFVSPEGVKTSVRNLNKFSRENNLTCENLLKVHSGIRNHHKGWTKYCG